MNYWTKANPSINKLLERVCEQHVIFGWANEEMRKKLWIDRLSVSGKPLKRLYIQEKPYEKYIIAVLGALLGALFAELLRMVKS